jgi:hypothetical protein
MRVVVFSKDRPLQLQAYLQSLLTLAAHPSLQIYVISPHSEDYNKLLSEYDWRVAWLIEENGFDATIRKFSESLYDDDIILFGCDDVNYIRPVNLGVITNIMQIPNILGFSLRLGKNILNRPEQINDSKVFFEWEWTGKPSHWGYPFELMASAYRGSLIKEIINDNKSQMQCPNHLESHGVNYCINNKRDQPYMAMFNTPNYAVAQDVNRVQHHFQNKYDGGEEHDAEYLKTLFRQRKKLDWENLFGIVPNEPFVGRNYWKIK